MSACLCGAIDCPACGRAQGYVVQRDPRGFYYNPEHDSEDDGSEYPVLTGAETNDYE